MDESTQDNLRDAGCAEAFICDFDELVSDEARLRKLKSYRGELLGSVHAEQKKLECLDYLIYQLRCGQESHR